MIKFIQKIKISVLFPLFIICLIFFPLYASGERESNGETLVVGYYTEEEGHLPSSYLSASTNMEKMSMLAPFWFRLNQYDATDIEITDGFSEIAAHNLVAEAHSKNLSVIPVIHNFLYDDKTLTQDLVTEMLSSPESQDRCINNIVSLLKYYNFDGVNMDFEGIRISDRDNLSLFYTELGARLRAEGYIFTTAIPAKGNDSHNPWAAPYDYDAIGEAADLVMLMMYNEHGFPGSGSGPVSSIGFNTAVVDYAIEKIPTEKIILAEPVFGFDFNLQTGGYTYLSHEMAMSRLEKYAAETSLDENSKTPFFTYTDTNNHKHEVWYEDKSSLSYKLDLTEEYNLAGVALWRLGMEDPQIWDLIAE